jgi:hypothetical protein
MNRSSSKVKLLVGLPTYETNINGRLVEKIALTKKFVYLGVKFPLLVLFIFSYNSIYVMSALERVLIKIRVRMDIRVDRGVKYFDASLCIRLFLTRNKAKAIPVTAREGP